MVPIQRDRDVCIWWSVNTLGEPMDLVFYGHCGSTSETGTNSPLNIHFTRRHNRGPSPDASQSSNDDSSHGMNPESSATAAKRAPLLETTMTKNGMRNTGTVHRSVTSCPFDRWLSVSLLIASRIRYITYWLGQRGRIVEVAEV